MKNDFDLYAENYRDIINRGARITGENYEYFIKLRIQLLAHKIKGKTGRRSDLRILDFGCGTGITETFLHTSFPDATIYGVDISRESINEAKKTGNKNIHFVQLASQHLVEEFKEGFFDIIYSNGTLHHIPRTDHMTVLKQLYRILKNKGDMFIFENNPFNPVMRIAMRNNPFDKGSFLIFPGYIKKCLRSAGFNVNAVDYYVFYPKILKILRPTEKFLVRVPLGAQYLTWSSKK